MSFKPVVITEEEARHLIKEHNLVFLRVGVADITVWYKRDDVEYRNPYLRQSWLPPENWELNSEWCSRGT
jgi:hypothetical protein